MKTSVLLNDEDFDQYVEIWTIERFFVCFFVFFTLLVLVLSFLKININGCC